MKLASKLLNPFVLVAQGFALGGLLFLALQSDAGEARAAEPAPRASILAL